MPPVIMKNVVVYMMGFYGSGKYTIAQEICAGADNFKLVDNHLINNPVFSLINQDGITPFSESVWDNVKKIRRVVMDTLIHISSKDYNFVLTNALKDGNAEDQAFYDETYAMAQARKAIFIPVRIFCSIEEMQRRIVSPNRAQRFKITDINSPRLCHETEEVLKVRHDNLLNLDVSAVSAQQAAAEILQHAKHIYGES
ncbi:MAG: hypothetical protein KAJ40_06970 [Alphaproteobacteria bacterium]|nr:hypothetical protein [Alphaproteobacteria bacterium]